MPGPADSSGFIGIDTYRTHLLRARRWDHEALRILLRHELPTNPDGHPVRADGLFKEIANRPLAFGVAIRGDLYEDPRRGIHNRIRRFVLVQRDWEHRPCSPSWPVI